MSDKDWLLVSRTKLPVSGVMPNKLESDPTSNFIRAAWLGTDSKVEAINTKLAIVFMVVFLFGIDVKFDTTAAKLVVDFIMVFMVFP